jgi:hypothetical protein
MLNVSIVHSSEDPLVKYEFEEIKAAIEFDRTVAANVGWKSLFTTRGNLKRLRIIVALAFFSQWSGNGLVSYYLARVLETIGITDPNVQLLINGILHIWNLFWALLGAFVVERAGRRLLFLSSITGMLIFFIMQTVCSAVYAERGDSNAGHAVIAFIFLFYAAYEYVLFDCVSKSSRSDSDNSVAFSPLIVSYTVEILPFAVRAKGFTIFNFSISLSLIFNQYINPIALGMAE